jgi:hypothetical protein
MRLVLPPHEGAAHVSHNPHKGYYLTVEQYEADGHMNADDWVSQESRAYAIEHNEVWELQWYPDTPIGFCTFAGGRWEDIVERLQKEGLVQ